LLLNGNQQSTLSIQPGNGYISVNSVNQR